MALLTPAMAAHAPEFEMEGVATVLKQLNSENTMRNHYRRKSQGAELTANKSAGGRPINPSPSADAGAQKKRIYRASRAMYAVLADRPEADQALAVNELIETYLSRGARLELRQQTFVEREAYVAVRASIYTLREKFWTAENWLELRLLKYIATSVFKVGHKLFSMKQSDDGVWERQTLIPAPSNLNRARQDHIYGPLHVPSPFRHSTTVAGAQEELLKDHPFDISEDGIAASIDPFQAANLAVGKAVANDNLEPPNASRPFRMQFLADAVGYFRGKRQATRAGVRIPNLKDNHNSKHYSTNVSLFLGTDHYEELEKQLEPVYKKLNTGMRTVPTGKDEVGNEQWSSALFTDQVRCDGCGEAEITDGGDAA